ncbi:hypothetical protein ACHWQZ_G009555 [Mnemiopsis leidyi]
MNILGIKERHNNGSCTLNYWDVGNKKIFQCPKRTKGVLTRFDKNNCTFSSKCYGYSEEAIAMQACDCDLVDPISDIKRNTTICLNRKGEYEAVPTQEMCLNESSVCLNSNRTAALSSTTFCNDKRSIFKCSNGKIIPRSLRCNYIDDCGTLSDGEEGHYFSKQPLFEDEADCQNQQYGVTCKLNGTDLMIWVPPFYQKCKGTGICENGEDVNGIFNCSERLQCEKDGSNRQVYEGNMCDPTLKDNQYCDVRALTFINCSKNWNEDADAFTCLYNDYNSTLDKSLICDGESTCDNDEDEKCFHSIKRNSSDTCTDNMRTDNEVCMTRNEIFIFCPNSTLQVVNSRLVCDGENDCKYGESEEGKCFTGPVYNSLYENKTTYDYNKITLHFEPQCIPGLAKALSQCRKYVYFHKPGENYINKTLCDGESQTPVCTVQYDEEISITILQINSDISGMKLCNDNGKAIKITDWCDTECDCDDCADEKNCTETNPRTFQCGNENSTYIPYRQVCDGQTNCRNSTDECSEICPDDHTRNILTWKYIPVAGLIGSAAFLINGASLLAHCKELTQISTTNGFINLLLVTLIALGDFMIGLYMLLVLAITLYFGDTYCPERNNWLSSSYCSGLGILSTTGTMAAMLSMTVLSVFRVYSIKMMISLGEATRKIKLKVTGIITLGIVVPSLAIAVLPSLDIFSTYFVNGLVFETNPFFRDVAKRDDIKRVIEYFNKTKINSYTWTDYDAAFKGLYYQEDKFSGLTNPTKRIGFYGNQGVCLFKYFVTLDDPQVAFSMSIIGLSSVCFVIISLCYIIIFKYAASTSSATGSQETQKRSLRRLQNKVTLIIITDFLTWIPFITVAILHCVGKFDATQLYEFCSILLIPINSVINPIIYNGDKLFVLARRYFLQGRSGVSSSQRMSQTVQISQVTSEQTKLSSMKTKTK